MSDDDKRENLLAELDEALKINVVKENTPSEASSLFGNIAKRETTFHRATLTTAGHHLPWSVRRQLLTTREIREFRQAALPSPPQAPKKAQPEISKPKLVEVKLEGVEISGTLELILYHRFPFYLSKQEHKDLVKRAIDEEDYSLWRILQDLTDYGPGKWKKDKYYDELFDIVDKPDCATLIKSYLNAGGDANGGDGALLSIAFDAQQIGNLRLLLAAKADPKVIYSDDLRKARRARGGGNLADAILEARYGMPIRKASRYFYVPPPQKKPAP